MAYTQAPGRGNKPKTGDGLPTPFLQVKMGYTKELGKAIEERDIKNLASVTAESQAKSDSTNAANFAKFSGRDLVDRRREGNKAANIVRKKAGVPTVDRGRIKTGSSFPGGDKYSKDFDNSVDYYSRTGSVEKDVPMTRNEKTGELDVKKKISKTVK